MGLFALGRGWLTTGREDAAECVRLVDGTIAREGPGCGACGDVVVEEAMGAEVEVGEVGLHEKMRAAQKIEK